MSNFLSNRSDYLRRQVDVHLIEFVLVSFFDIEQNIDEAVWDIFFEQVVDVLNHACHSLSKHVVSPDHRFIVPLPGPTVSQKGFA